VEPIPETAEAIEQFGPFVIEDDDLRTELEEKAAQVTTLVPQCIGISVASNLDDITFTLVSTEQEAPVLDALQYVDGGPCVEGAQTGELLAFDQAQLFDEGRWQLFAQGTRALGVASTLTLPVSHDEVVVGTVNLYASTSDAFDGHHEELADIFGAWAPGAVTNSDLSFTTRLVAEQAPDKLRAEVDVAIATAIISSRTGLDDTAAGEHLKEAAGRAGVTPARLAETIVMLDHLQNRE
jgi:GAF domain-containing protein